LASNKFEEMLGDAHAIMTAEGDNSVLMMKVAKERLAWAERSKKGMVLDKDFAGFADVKNPEYLLWLFRRREVGSEEGRVSAS
jgi:acyl-CoA oxidase